jgi:glutathione S-transferase
MADQQDVELFQFIHSHFNEKVRWGLDWKGVPHKRTTLLPGPHSPVIRKMTGQTQTPVLRIGKCTAAGSGAIMLKLEKLFPERPLLPADDDAKARVLALQTEIDDRLGKAVQFCGLALARHYPDYLCELMAWHLPWLKRRTYRALFPVILKKMSSYLGLDEDGRFEAMSAEIKIMLDDIGEKSANSGFLVGGRFTLADLAAAAIMNPLAKPAECQVRWPEDTPGELADWQAEWKDHPACVWARQIAAAHRGQSAEIV